LKKGFSMRVAIRLLTGATLVFFVVAIAAAQLGEQARATQPSYQWPGLLEALIVVALLALTVLLFLVASILGLALAIRAKEWSWAFTIGLSAAGIILIYLGSFLPNGFLLPVLRLLPPFGNWGFLLFFVPALLGDVFLALYGFRTSPDPRPSLFARLDG
jgi:hypothetical protein